MGRISVRYNSTIRLVVGSAASCSILRRSLVGNRVKLLNETRLERESSATGASVRSDMSVECYPVKIVEQ